MTRKASRQLVAFAVATAAALAACGQGTGAPGTSPSGTPLSTPALKLAVLRAVGGKLDYCDPDQYPVARGTPLQNAERRLPQIMADRAVFDAILSSLHITDGSHLTDQQTIEVSQAYKQMLVIQLQRKGDAFAFQVSVPGSDSTSPGVPEILSGTVSRTGQVHIDSRRPGAPRACPICLARGDLVQTPRGPVAVQDVRVGMPVWTADSRGRRIPATVIRIGRALVPLGHEVVRLVLADGRTALASPGHPTFDGRPIASLRAGDRFEGSRVASANLLPYRATFTYDLLPSGPTGAYFVNGVLLGSTLAPARPPALRSVRAR